MPLYRLKHRQKHYIRNEGASGMVLKSAGDTLELTDAQAHAIRDKVELVGETEGEREVRKAEETVVEGLSPQVVERDDGLGFDVIHAETGEPMNDLPLDEDEAKILAKQGA